MRTARPRSVALFALALVACADHAAGTPVHQAGHLFRDEASGVAMDLPSSWSGRYRLSDRLSQPLPGLQRELALRFVRADSSVVMTPPLLVVRVFATTAWLAMPLDSSAQRFGTVVARDAARTVAVSTAAANPLHSGSADALAFDSLMFVVLQRPLRASLRPESVSAPRDPGAPGPAAP